MNERLRKLRRALDLTQQGFGDKIGMKQNTIATYEMGRATPSDPAIRSICREFNVNEDWLRYGTGDMFVKKSRDEEIATFIGRVQMDDKDSFKKRVIAMLSKLDESEWELLEKMALNAQKKED